MLDDFLMPKIKSHMVVQIQTNHHTSIYYKITHCLRSSPSQDGFPGSGDSCNSAIRSLVVARIRSANTSCTESFRNGKSFSTLLSPFVAMELHSLTRSVLPLSEDRIVVESTVAARSSLNSVTASAMAAVPLMVVALPPPRTTAAILSTATFCELSVELLVDLVTEVLLSQSPPTPLILLLDPDVFFQKNAPPLLLLRLVSPSSVDK